MSEEAASIRALRLQAQVCRQMGSAFTAGLLEHAADDAVRGGPTAKLLAPWAAADLKALFSDAAALRLAAALHDLALSGEEPELSAAYACFDAEAAWRAAQTLMPRHLDRLARFMEHEPQTNEVRRSIALLGGFLEVARQTGLPLRCFEAAASAGLNLSWDTYRYRLNGADWGPADARVAMDTDWSGGLPPLDAQVAVIERAACDRRPTDLADPDQRRRLLAYYWPDQTERMARIRAAIDQAVATGVSVEAADLVEWAKARVAPRAGAATVFYHSVVWSYLSPETQAALTETVEAIGEAASAEAPFAWLRMETEGKDLVTLKVRLTLWPGGEDRLLAEAHSHAAAVKWLG